LIINTQSKIDPYSKREGDMAYLFMILALILALVDWISVAKNWRKVEFFAKPAVMLALLAWIGLNNGFQGPMLWFALGVFFSLGGDVFLMLPREQFILGLISFLIGHVCYLIGFNSTGLFFNFPLAIVILVVAAAASQIYLKISAGLRASKKDSLRIPVFVYTIVISLMLISALATLIRPDWRFSAAAIASSGALLFFISDTLLAWNRFVKPLPRGRLYSIIPYHLGQIGIVLGAALYFLQ